MRYAERAKIRYDTVDRNYYDAIIVFVLKRLMRQFSQIKRFNTELIKQQNYYSPGGFYSLISRKFP